MPPLLQSASSMLKNVIRPSDTQDIRTDNLYGFQRRIPTYSESGNDPPEGGDPRRGNDHSGSRGDPRHGRVLGNGSDPPSLGLPPTGPPSLDPPSGPSPSDPSSGPSNVTPYRGEDSQFPHFMRLPTVKPNNFIGMVIRAVYNII